MTAEYEEIKKQVRSIGNGLHHCPTCMLIYENGDGIYHKGYHKRMVDFYERIDPQHTIYPYYEDPEELRRDAFNAKVTDEYRRAVLALIAHYYRALFIAQGAHGPYDRGGEYISFERYIAMFLGANGDMPLPSLRSFGPRVYAALIKTYGTETGLVPGNATIFAD